jgi:threonine dehydratase
MRKDRNSLRPPTLAEIYQARERISSFVYRTPLIPLHGQSNVYLKLENLQPIGSFKLRGSGNAMELAGRERLKDGVYTASAGNMAQGVAWNALRMGVRCASVVPDHAPETKIAAMQRLNCEVIRVPFDEWWNVLQTGKFEGLQGLFIHPVCDAAVIAGNGTIGLEIIEDLPDVTRVLIPYGGGGLSSGISAAIRSLKSDVNVYACEVDTAAPLSASLEAGEPRAVSYTASFVDGIGGKTVLPQMWPLVSALLDGAITVSLEQIAQAIRYLMERNRVIAEGAGAASVAAALANPHDGKTVCVISGGNIDSAKLAKILLGEIP